MTSIRGFCVGLLAGMALLAGPVPQAEATADWTVLVYLSADNDLEDEGIDDFLEMAEVGSNSDVNIVVIFDRTPGESKAYGDWTDTRRGLINQHDVPDTSWGQSIGEANLGDPATLVNFVQWGVQQYPANRLALVLWDHGNGWRHDPVDGALAVKAVCYDDTDFDHLSTQEVREALAALDPYVGRMDLLGFDACLMGMVEVGYEIRAHADVMVASEKTEPLDGWPYDDILEDLVATPGMTAIKLGQKIVQRYHDSYPLGETLAATELLYMDLMAEELDDFARAVRTQWDGDTAYCGVHAYNAMTAVGSGVYAEAHGSAWAGSHGLAVYFPDSDSSVDPAYDDGTILLPGVTEWDEFLTEYHSDLGGSWIGDARGKTQDYKCPNDLYDHADLYDFCHKIIDALPHLLWVDFTFDGSETGSVDQPFDTLQEAVDAAGSGDTIAIQPGSTSETLVISSKVTLRACHATVVIGAP